jgi:hypothetical protein
MSENPPAPDVENGKAHGPATEYSLPERHRFCGCCCGMPTAVIICDVLAILSGIISLFLYYERLSAGIILLLVAICACFGLGIHGAMAYKIWPVVVALLAYIVQIALSIYFSALWDIVLNLLFAYPHVMLIIEGYLGHSRPNVDHCC